MTATTAPTSSERSPDRLFLGLFALAIIIVGGLWFGIQQVIAPSTEVVAKIVKAPLPETFRPIYAQQTPSGDVAEFFDSASHHKFSIARAPFESSTSATPRDLMDGIIEFQRNGGLRSGLAPLSIKFSQALFKGQSAYDVSDASITVAGETVPALVFVTTKGANHALTVMNRGNEQLTILALKKNSPVDIGAFGRFIELALGTPTVTP